MKSLYGFVYSTKSLAFLNTIPVKLRKQIVNNVTALAHDPPPPGHKLVRGMSADEERVYRIRSGDYRVLYLIRTSPNHVVILDIDHRKDIYK